MLNAVRRDVLISGDFNAPAALQYGNLMPIAYLAHARWRALLSATGSSLKALITP